jgi:hypothetical protein
MLRGFVRGMSRNSARHVLRTNSLASLERASSFNTSRRATQLITVITAQYVQSRKRPMDNHTNNLPNGSA